MADETSTERREIPGSYGLPLIGLLTQSISFFKNLLGFCNDRIDKYESTVFKASPGIKSIVILEQQSLATLFDISICDKPYGFGPLRPDPPRVGHIRPTICSNGEDHQLQKDFVLDLINRRADRLAPTLDAVADPYIERWAKEGSFEWGPDIDSLMSDFVFKYAVGAQLDPEDVAGWAYSSLVVGPLWLWRPGTSKAVGQLNRMLAAMKASPEYEGIAEMGMKEANMSADETAKQLLFTLAFNSWGGLQGVARSVLSELFLNPEWADKAAEEAASVLPAGGATDLEMVRRLPVIGRIVMETMRLHTPVPTVFGIPNRDVEVKASTGTYLVQKGEMMQGVLTWSNRNPKAFEDADVFRPERYESREAIRNLVWAAGPDVDRPEGTNHMCAGQSVVYQTLALFLAKVLRYKWTLSETPDWGTGFSAASKPITPVNCTSFTAR